MSFRDIARPILTALCAMVMTLFLWMVLVSLLDRRSSIGDNVLWAVSLWFSAITSTLFVAYSRFAARPVLACTIGFGIFGLVYFACEGPIFGNVSQGGDPAMTNFVFWNLVYLPLGAFVASDAGALLGAMRRKYISRRERTSVCRTDF